MYGAGQHTRPRRDCSLPQSRRTTEKGGKVSETRTWPKPTSRWLISGWSSTGSQDCKFSLFEAISSRRS